jgi:penicillin-binding protein 1B
LLCYAGILQGTGCEGVIEAEPQTTVLEKLAARRRTLLLGGLALAATAVLATGIVYYKKYAGIVDRRLHDGRWKAPSRLYARKLVLRPGLTLAPRHLVRFLEGLHYHRTSGAPTAPGSFSAGDDSVTYFPRDPEAADEPIQVRFHDERIGSVRGARSRRWYESQALEPQLVTFLLDEDRVRKNVVRYDELPAHLVQAVVAIEDRRFFNHGGLDPVGIVRAVARNIQAEGYAQGGSTITQQLARNSFLKPEKTLRRKLQEALLSFVLERRLEKSDILELYLNEIYFGQVSSFNILGVGQAARTFFDKDVQELTVGEAALLAGMIQSPNPYNPYRHREAARARRDQVLEAMVEMGVLDRDVAAAARAEPLPTRAPTLDEVDAPYYVELVKEQLERRYDARDLARRNLRVQTALDLRLQAIAEDVIEEGLAALERRAPHFTKSPLQGCLIALEPRTGAIVALVGGRSYKTSPYNRARLARRQPGSAFKPFVYLAAFESTFEAGRPAVTPATIFEDVPSTFLFEQEEYTPRNNDGRYLGPVTPRRALASSLNVATVKVAERVGYGAVADLWSKKLGIGARIKPYPALALGSFEATPLELATAYNVLANGGLKVEPVTVVEVVDEKDRTVDEVQEPPRPVVHAAAAYIVTDMMRSVIDEGTAYPVRELGFTPEAAGKTGTTNGSRDAWFIGFTPDLLCVVWIGFDDNTSLDLPASEAALPVWVEFMKRALAGTKASRFPAPPPGVVVRWIDRYTGLLASAGCPGRREAFIAGTEPRASCPVHHDSAEF